MCVCVCVCIDNYYIAPNVDASMSITYQTPHSTYVSDVRTSVTFRQNLSFATELSAPYVPNSATNIIASLRLYTVLIRILRSSLSSFASSLSYFLILICTGVFKLLSFSSLYYIILFPISLPLFLPIALFSRVPVFLHLITAMIISFAFLICTGRLHSTAPCS